MTIAQMQNESNIGHTYDSANPAYSCCCTSSYNYGCEYLHLLLITHIAATKERQCFLSTANFVTWPQLHPSVFISRSTDLVHVSFGLPRALLPQGVQRIAALGMDVNGILQTCPIHLHLRRLTSREMGCMPVLSWGCLFEILLGQ